MAENTNWLDQMLQNALAPKTGGNVLTDIGQILGNTAGGLSTGRQAESGLLLSKGALDANLFDAALKRKAMDVGLPETRAKQAVTGDLLANEQDVTPSGPSWLQNHLVTFNGGRRPSALGPNARSAGAALSQIGASNIGKDTLPEVPKSPNLPQAGLLDKLLSGAGIGSNLLGALSKGSGDSGGSIDLGKLFGNLFSHGGTTPGEDDGPTMDQLLGDVGPTSGGPATGTVDPSQSPGAVDDPMQEYLDWLAQHGGTGGGSGGSGGSSTGGDWWWGE